MNKPSFYVHCPGCKIELDMRDIRIGIYSNTEYDKGVRTDEYVTDCPCCRTPITITDTWKHIETKIELDKEGDDSDV